MSLLEEILESVFGKVHFMVLVGNRPALEIKLRDKEIVVDIKNPILAVEFGLEELLETRGKEHPDSALKKLKYKIFELEL
jgi:hypothetical protein